MKNENINIIRSACIAANPSIMELGFGCDVIAESSLVKNSYWNATLVAPNMGIGHWTCVAWQEAFPNVSKFATFKEKNFKHILGRPIRLADVLLSISSKFMCDSSFKGGISRDGGWYEDGKLLASWNLLLDDLTKQSPETIDFLASLLQSK